MKKMLTTTLLLLSGLSSAAEITKDQFVNLLHTNKKGYESIEVGMTSTELRHVEKMVNGKKIQCSFFLKSVVVSNEPPKYSVYQKVISLSDCGEESEIGDSYELVTKRKMLTVKDHLQNLDVNGEIYKYDLSGPQITLSWGDAKIGKEVFDVRFSQFYNTVSYEGLVIKSSLLLRGWTDPSTLELDGLQEMD